MIIGPVNDAIDLVEAEVYEGATCTGVSPAVITTAPTQWNFSVAVPLEMTRLCTENGLVRSPECVRVRLSIHVRAGCLGVGLRSRKEKRFYDELWIPAGDTFDEFEVYAPMEEEGADLIFRNVWPDGATEAACRIIGSEYGAPGRYYLVHGVGKVATQSIETAIRQRTGQVDRLHLLAEPSLQRMEQYYLGHHQPVPDGIAEQIARGRYVRKELESVKDRKNWVAIGFRDPLDLAIASFFQNIGLYRSDLTFSEENREAELDWVEKEFKRLFRDEHGLSNIDAWMVDEVFQFYGLDVYQHEVGVAPYVVAEHGRNRRFMFYRVETLREYFVKVLGIMGVPLVGPVLTRNVGSEKLSGPLYQAFRARFEPSADMVEAFYNTPFFRHFYGHAPNYESLPAALRRARKPFLLAN